MSYVREISWAEGVAYHNRHRRARGLTPDSGAGDVIRGIVMGMTIGIAAWALMIVMFIYVL
jgi:hypothetical protein